MKIVTHHVYPPIPDRSFDWSAIDSDSYDGAPDSGPRAQIIGYGRTEFAAIDDLLDQLDSARGERRARLIQFLGGFYSRFEQNRTVFDGYGRAGIEIGFDDLTDAALERFAAKLCGEFWFRKRINRQNREIARTLATEGL